MEIKCFKSAVTLFFKLNPIGPCLVVSSEILCVLVAQGTAKMPEIKFGGIKKSGLKPAPPAYGVDWDEWQIFFQTSNFDLWQFAAP